MGKRRKPGDRVWVESGESFGASRGEWATIIDDPEMNPTFDDGKSHMGCLFTGSIWCIDKHCQEWPNLETEDGRYFYHVSECRMHDAKQSSVTRRKQPTQLSNSKVGQND